jgi:hypothetical protein
MFTPTDPRNTFMGKPKDPEDVKEEATSQFEAWLKRNERKIKLVEDLTLDCELCKTKEAKDLLSKTIDLSLKDVRVEIGKLNRQNANLFKDLPKPAVNDLSKDLAKAFEKLTTIYNKGNVKIWIEIDPSNLTEKPFNLEFSF